MLKFAKWHLEGQGREGGVGKHSWADITEPPCYHPVQTLNGKVKAYTSGREVAVEGGWRDGGQPRLVEVPLMARNTWREFCNSERIISSW